MLCDVSTSTSSRELTVSDLVITSTSSSSMKATHRSTMARSVVSTIRIGSRTVLTSDLYRYHTPTTARTASADSATAQMPWGSEWNSMCQEPPETQSGACFNPSSQRTKSDIVVFGSDY